MLRNWLSKIPLSWEIFTGIKIVTTSPSLFSAYNKLSSDVFTFCYRIIHQRVILLVYLQTVHTVHHPYWHSEVAIALTPAPARQDVPTQHKHCQGSACITDIMHLSCFCLDLWFSKRSGFYCVNDGKSRYLQ